MAGAGARRGATRAGTSQKRSRPSWPPVISRASVGRRGDRADGLAAVVGEDGDRHPPGQVPDPGRPVVAGGGEEAAAGEERHPRDRIRRGRRAGRRPGRSCRRGTPAGRRSIGRRRRESIEGDRRPRRLDAEAADGERRSAVRPGWGGAIALIAPAEPRQIGGRIVAIKAGGSAERSQTRTTLSSPAEKRRVPSAEKTSEWIGEWWPTPSIARIGSVKFRTWSWAIARHRGSPQGPRSRTAARIAGRAKSASQRPPPRRRSGPVASTPPRPRILATGGPSEEGVSAFSEPGPGRE